MGVLNFFKQTIMRCDLLACPATLRVRGQPAYESVLGGFLSMAIMSFFIVIFSTSFIQVLNRVDISSSTSTSDQTSSTNSVADLQFAIGIEGVRLGGGLRYFDILMQQISITGNSGSSPTTTKTHILLTPCNKDDWKDVGDNFQEQFDVFQMERMLCVANSSQLTMRGYEGSPEFSYLSLKVKKCSNNTYESHSCYSNPTITSYMTTYLMTNDFFKVKFLIVDTRISPAQSDPVTKILQKKIFLSFTNELGTKGFINFAHYSVTTDTSIMPYTDQTQVTGSYIEKYQTNTIGLSSDKFIHLNFYKATEQLEVTRAVVKVDQMLSYVGGLFGLLWVVVAFFLGAFNQYRYQLYAAQAAFTFDDKGRKIKQSDFGILSYIGYSIYDWLDLVGCAPKRWTKMRQIHQTREEIGEQLDVTYLFRKIRNLQKTTACLLNENKRICSMLTREATLGQTLKQRKLLQIYSKLAPTVSQTASSLSSNPNRIQNLDQKSGQNFIYGGKMTIQDNLSELQSMDVNAQPFQEQDEQYQQLMNMIKNAYSSLQAQNDQTSKRLKEKIPSQIKRIIYKKRRTRTIKVEDFTTKKFQSFKNSFVDPKFK